MKTTTVIIVLLFFVLGVVIGTIRYDRTAHTTTHAVPPALAAAIAKGDTCFALASGNGYMCYPAGSGHKIATTPKCDPAATITDTVTHQSYRVEVCTQ